MASITTKKFKSTITFPYKKIKLNVKQRLEFDNVNEILDSIGFKLKLRKDSF